MTELVVEVDRRHAPALPPPSPSVRPEARRDWQRLWRRRVVVADVTCLVVAMIGALGVRFGFRPADLELTPAHALPYAVPTLLLGAGWAASLALHRCYDPKVLGVGPEEYKRVLVACLRFWGVVAIVAYVSGVDLARGYVAVAFPLGTFLLSGARMLARKVLHRARARTDAWSHRVLVVGKRRSVVRLVEEIRREPYAGFHVVGACLPVGPNGFTLRAEDAVPVVGGLTDVAEAVRSTGADTVAIASGGDLGPDVLKRLSWALEGLEVEVAVAPSLFDVAGPRLHVRPVGGLPLIYVEQPDYAGSRRVVKAAFDRVGAALGLVVLAPLLVVLAVCVRLDSPGPVFYRQTRVGRHGREFTLLKLRSMVVDADRHLASLAAANESEGPLFKMRRDPRVTRVGGWLRRYSLDELPQLLNVVRGEMSLVGPRPPLWDEVHQYSQDVHRRLLVRPGMTGLWQVSGRSDLPWEEAVRLDLSYVENWSLTADLLILWKTVRAVVQGPGAY